VKKKESGGKKTGEKQLLGGSGKGKKTNSPFDGSYSVGGKGREATEDFQEVHLGEFSKA